MPWASLFLSIEKGGTVGASVNAEYIELKKRVQQKLVEREQEGLSKSSTYFHVRQVALVFALCAISLALIVFYKGLWGQMGNAVFLAFIYGLIGFLMHEVVHNQVISAPWLRPVCMIFNVLIGWNCDWWGEKHTKHHVYSNQVGLDNDVDIRWVAFTKEQAEGKKGLYRLITRYQDTLFIPLLSWELWHLRYAAVKYLLKQNTWQAKVDLALIAIHMAVYLGVLFFFLPPWHALAFVAVHNGLVGIYLGMAFAPNHIGMPILKPGTVPAGFLRQQVLTSRNIRGGWFITLIFGGLNWQIEHHLFPKARRPNLRWIAVIVEQFCLEEGISYCSVSLYEAFRQVFAHMRKMKRYAR